MNKSHKKAVKKRTNLTRKAVKQRRNFTRKQKSKEEISQEKQHLNSSILDITNRKTNQETVYISDKK